MTRYIFPSTQTREAAKRALRDPSALVDFQIARRIEATVPLPKPDEYDETRSYEMSRASYAARTRDAETAPPRWTDYPAGTLAIDRDGELLEMRLIRLTDPKLREQETPGRYVIEKYVEWLKAGHTPPPIRVTESERGSYIISDGHHRVAALRAAKRQTVKAWVVLTVNRVLRLDDDGTPLVMPEGVTLERARIALGG